MSASREHLFWLGFGALVIAAVKCISWQASEASRLGRIAAEHEQLAHAEAQATDNKSKPQQTEDDVSVETLAILMNHPNYDIRNAARKIVLNRFAKNAECCAQLSKDYFNPENHPEAKAVMNEILGVADQDCLVRPPSSESSDDTNISIDRILQAASQRQSTSVREQPRLPFVSRENRGSNGEVVSLTLGQIRTATDDDIAQNPALRELEVSPEELGLRRWRRREAMVVEVDSDEGVAELVMPS